MNDKVVMVLDDEPGVAKLCDRVLAQAGFDVIPMQDSRQAVSVLKQARVDLLLVDIRMPKLDGFQVMEIARTHQPDIAVVIMTGFGTLETATKAMRMGANGLILKPFYETKELVEAVQGALDDRNHEKNLARLQALQPLIQITQNIFAETHQESLLDLILQEIRTHLECEHVGYYVRVPGGGQERKPNGEPAGEGFLELVASLGDPLPGESINLAGGPLAWADVWGRPIRIDNEEPDGSGLDKLIAEFGLGSVMAVPVQRTEGQHTVLMAGRTLGAEGFGKSDLEMFTVLAGQVAVAIENARLYADLRESVDTIKVSQRALVQAEKMAAIGRLTASIAHEVNNPLQSVRNCLHLAGRRDISAEKRDEYLTMAGTELDRLMETMNQMLDFYRPSSRKKENVNINSLVQSVNTLLEKQLQERGIQLQTSLALNLPDIQAERNQLQQVLFNILLNAMEAISEGGTIYIDTQRGEAAIEILIADSGPGIPEEEQSKIFEPFSSSKPHGTGLGLSVSYSIVDAHGGTLELLNGNEHPRAQGANFRISLPLTETI